MASYPKIKVPDLSKAAVKTGFVVGFASMTGAAILNSVSWLAFGEASAPGKAGFVLALGVSLLAGLLSAHLTSRQMRRLERIEDHAKAIAKGDVAIAFKAAEDASDPLHQQLNLIAEAQLKRVEEFHRLLEDSRIREERLYEALDLMDDEIAVFDPSGMLVCVNKAFTKQCNAASAPVGPGMLRREILKALSNAPLNDVPHGERDMWLDHQFQMRELALKSQKPVDSLQRDGRHLRFTLIETPSKNQIEITTDISDAVSQLLEAERLHREVGAAAEIKSVTVSQLMNTIRAPMTGVLAAAELLNETELDDNQKGKLNLIRRSSGTLLGIVQDMIDMGGREPEPNLSEMASPPDVLLERATLVDIDPHKPRRAILLVRSEELEGRLTSLLQQDNIQSIALETVDLALTLLSDADGDALHADFVMTDDAEAVTQLRSWVETLLPVNRPQIIDLNRVMTDGFAPQTEAPSGPAPAAQAAPAQVIAKEAAPAVRMNERHSLPEVSETLIAQTPNEPKKRKLPLDVMIVEDNDVNQIVYDQIMGNCGHNYLIVSSGEEGVNTAVREKPRLVLMDISMPGLNGLEATRRIRAQMAGGRRAVIVGMTSHLLSGDREKCLAAGMDDYALKPTAPGPLRAQISSWLGLAERQTQAAG